MNKNNEIATAPKPAPIPMKSHAVPSFSFLIKITSSSSLTIIALIGEKALFLFCNPSINLKRSSELSKASAMDF